MLLLLATLALTTCAAPAPKGVVVLLPDQPVIITEAFEAKYSRVYWRYEVLLPGGRTLPVYGDNGTSGYYHKTYRLTPGQVVRRTVVLYTSREGIYAQELNFDDFAVPPNQR